jgi:hypothetical protein
MTVKSNPNTALTYISLALAQYLDTATLDGVVEAIKSTNLASTAEETAPGNTTWTYKLGGSWAKALDDVLMPDIITPPATLRNFVAVIGASGSTVTLTWTAKAYIAAYTVDTTAGQPIKWTGTLQLTGSPVRS